MLSDAPYKRESKPYGRALVEYALQNPEVVCLSADLSKQCEVDLFRDAIPERFVQCGMAEANMIGVAAGLARAGMRPFVHSFGVFATRRAFDQIVNSIAVPGSPVAIVGFMPGVSSPGGPSHQAIDDIALMRAIPGMTVLDVADSTESRQVVEYIASLSGPAYVRLKRGDVPRIFDDVGYRLEDNSIRSLQRGDDTLIFCSGMMLGPCLEAVRVLHRHDLNVSLAHVPVIKPLDTAGIVTLARDHSLVVTVENHSVIGGLGSAVAEAISDNGLGLRVRRIGIRDTYAEGSLTAAYLFRKYGLTANDVIQSVWSEVGRTDAAPSTATQTSEGDVYSPV
jgi:transketolase